jgi:phage gp29-like protein
MPWYAPWRKEKQPPPTPRTGRYISGARNDYDISTNARRLTPEKLARAMRNAESGDTAPQFEIFDLVEQDPHVTAELGKRRRKITSRAFRVFPAGKDEQVDPRAQAAADLCTRLILGDEGRGGISNWLEAVRDLTDAVGKGIAVAQIVWDLDDGLWVPRALQRWPQSELIFGDPMGWGQYLQTEDEVKVRTDEEQTDGEPLEANGWVVHVHKTWSVPIARCALLRSVTWFYLFKHFDVKDWSIFLERMGIPPRWATYPPGVSNDEKTTMLNALLSMGRDAACILPEGSTLSLLESSVSASGGDPHKLMAEYCDEQISKAINGSTMSTTQGDRGARSAKESFLPDERAIARDDTQRLCETIRRDLLGPIVRLNLGDDVPIPYCALEGPDDEDLLIQSQIDDCLVNKVGLQLTRDYFYTRYSRPRPKAGEEIVTGARMPGLEPAGEETGEESTPPAPESPETPPA